MGWISKQPSGGWRARYRTPDGRVRSRTFRRKIDATRWLAEETTALARGVWIDPRAGRVTFAEWADRWLASRAALKLSTAYEYRSRLSSLILPRFGPVLMGRVQPIDVEEWQAALLAGGLSAARVRSARATLATVFEAAVSSGLVPRNPTRGVRPPRDCPREMLFLDAHQVELLAKAIRPPYGPLVHTLAYGGLRWGELVALSRRRVDRSRSRLHVAQSAAEVSGKIIVGPTKTYAERWVSVPAFLRDDLAIHLEGVEPDGLVFTAPRGGPLRRSRFATSAWRPAVAAAGLPAGLRVHDMRHTCASLLIAEGANPKAVQAHLGHSSIQVTFDRYGHLFPDETESLAAKMDHLRQRALADIAPSARHAAPETPGR